jgi:hypothetical protein
MKNTFYTLVAFVSLALSVVAQDVPRVISYQGALVGAYHHMPLFYDTPWSHLKRENSKKFSLLEEGAMKSNDGDVSGNHRESDFWVVKFMGDGQSSVNSQPKSNAKARIISIKPNPAEESMEIEITVTEVGTTELALYDMMGNKVKTLYQRITTAEDFASGNKNIHTSVDIRDVGTGQYILMLKTPTYTEAQQVMIVR